MVLASGWPEKLAAESGFVIGHFDPYHDGEFPSLCNIYHGSIRTLTIDLQFVALVPRDDAVPGNARYDIFTTDRGGKYCRIGIGIEYGVRKVGVGLRCPAVDGLVWADLHPANDSGDQMELVWRVESARRRRLAFGLDLMWHAIRAWNARRRNMIGRNPAERDAAE